MECFFFAKNLNMGAGSCTVTVISDAPSFTARWCVESDYPEKLVTTDVRHRMKVTKNGTYLVELTAGDEITVESFSVCHLRPKRGFEGGDGSPESPYLIANCAQFCGIHSDMSAHYRLIADLDFAREMKHLSWVPIGKYSFWEPDLDPDIPLEEQDLGYRYNFGFTGTLDGSGHCISGLSCYYRDSLFAGIFGSCGNGAYIHDLVVRDCVFLTANKCVGVIAGRAQDAVIERCVVLNASIVDPLSGGGVVGEPSDGLIIRACQFSGSITATTQEPYPPFNIGGICGNGQFHLQDEADIVPVIEDCCVKADITGALVSNGIAGGWPMVSRCFFTGRVEGTQYSAGVLSAVVDEIFDVKNCVCANAEIFTAENRPVSVWEPIWQDVKREYGISPERVPGWSNNAGRILCRDHTLSQNEKRFINYATASCQVASQAGSANIVEGSQRDGITISDEAAHDPEFYKGLGWDFDTVWEIGEDGFPQIQMKKINLSELQPLDMPQQ